MLHGHENQAATTCFHCQQCAEKLLKAALLAEGVDIPKIHELIVLSALFPKQIAPGTGMTKCWTL
jgi:HEPN domain-containing protein